MLFCGINSDHFDVTLFISWPTEDAIYFMIPDISFLLLLVSVWRSNMKNNLCHTPSMFVPPSEMGFWCAYLSYLLMSLHLPIFHYIFSYFIATSVSSQIYLLNFLNYTMDANEIRAQLIRNFRFGNI